MRLYSGQIPRSRAWRQPGSGRVPCPGEQTRILKALILGLYLKVERSGLAGKVGRKSCMSEGKGKSVERGVLVRRCVIQGLWVVRVK